MNLLHKYIKEVKSISPKDIFVPLTFYTFHPTLQKTEIKLKIEIADFIFISVRDVTIDNYLSLLKYLFPTCQIEDCQTTNLLGKVKGHPDFKLQGENKEIFYIELKNGDDRISQHQLDFAVENEETYFMFIGSVEEEKKITSEEEQIEDEGWLE